MITKTDNNFKLEFVQGILGFDEFLQYELIFADDADCPFFYLKVTDSDEPCFLACDPICFVPDYNVDFTNEIKNNLEFESGDELKCITIVTIPEDVSKTTANLKAPVIFNTRNNKAQQFVLNDTDYQIKHRLFAN